MNQISRPATIDQMNTSHQLNVNPKTVIGVLKIETVEANKLPNASI